MKFGKKFAIVVGAGVMCMPRMLFAATADLSISAGNIRFSEEVLYAGETVRLYATVKNYSETDIAAKVVFYQGAVLIGGSQTVSVLAGGGSDDVYVDYMVPKGTFNIRAVIQGQTPEDTNAANDEAITGLFTSVSDSDQDGVIDEEDNCPETQNADQQDRDNDGRGDVCDDDRDGDGVTNDRDAYPDDDTRTTRPIAQEEVKEEVTQPAQAIEPEPAAVQQTPEPVNDEQPVAREETVVTDTQLPAPPQGSPGIFGFGTLSISPYAQFSYRRIDWRTYEFTALPSVGQGEVTYAWDFGDGATSVQSTLVHAFPDAGQYTVTLAVIDEAGTMVSDAQVFDISFFHLHNPWIQATLAALFFILLGLIWFLVRLKESKEEEREEV
jgi:hypothetical protein